jgi:DNA-binding NarL/FixJ family response regulator
MRANLAPHRIRVCIIEKDPDERAYLSALINGAPELLLLCAHATPDEALDHLAARPPDLIFVDLSNSDGTDLKFLQRKERVAPYTPVLALIGEGEQQILVQLLELGVRGCMQKPCPPEQLLRAMYSLHGGGAAICSSVALQVVDYFHARGRVAQGLTLREREVLNLLAQGAMQDEIARRLSLSVSTVRTHLRNIIAKLQVHSRTEAVAKYLNPADFCSETVKMRS